ncbi:hypothetical protein ACFQVA_22600 [Actinomadura keratinilytica]
MSRRPDPQFVTFDMYGTLTDFPVGAAAEKTIEAISSPGSGTCSAAGSPPTSSTSRWATGAPTTS